MKHKKALSWETISEGTLTALEIKAATDHRKPITLTLVDATGVKSATVQIITARGPVYNVTSSVSVMLHINKRPYKYLSCAVRCAVKEYKRVLRSGKWKVLTK
jgi:hypothetical protein